jgi:hypothetical protein
MITSKEAVKRIYAEHLKHETPERAVHWCAHKVGLTEQQVEEIVSEK